MVLVGAPLPVGMQTSYRGRNRSGPTLAQRLSVPHEATASRPELLLPFKTTILNRLSKAEQQEVRWHVAPMLVRLLPTNAEEDTVVGLLLGYTNDRSSIVKTMAMQALAGIALRGNRWRPEIARHKKKLAVTGTPAMTARGRKLLKLLAKASHG